MKSFALLPLAALLAAAGCKPSSGSQASSSSSNSSSSGIMDAPAEYGRTLIKAKQDAGKTVDVASLNREIEMFQVDKGRFPKDLDELVQEKYIEKIPPVPYGMKLDYDATTGTVKVVNQ